MSEGALAPGRIVQALRPFLSQERQARIESVVSHRLLSIAVIIENPYDPHNAAAVMRSCEAFGVLNLHIVKEDATLSFSTHVTQRADKWLNIFLHRSIDECAETMQRSGFRILAARPPMASDNAEEISTHVTGRPLALMFGNEHRGLSERAIEVSDGSFSLPMYGFSESFNLSVSAALTLQRVTELQRRSLGCTGDLTQEARLQLLAAYYARAVDSAPSVLWRQMTSP